MRKALSWVLVLAMVLTSFSMVFAGSYPDAKGQTCEDAVNVLSELGVVNGYEDGTYHPEKTVTRAEAAKLIVAALGLTNYATNAKASFKDLAGYAWAEGFIGYSEKMELLLGYGDGKFGPGDTVTYDQWATIIVRALGYTDEFIGGQWPANYNKKAITLGIFDDVDNAGNVGANRGDVAIMLYNALNAYIGYVDKEGEWLKNDPKDTMFVRLGVKTSTVADVVTYGDAKDAVANLMGNIGQYATLLLNKDKKAISVDEVKSTFLTGKLTSKDKFKVGDVEYTIKDAKFDVVSPGAYTVFIENGKNIDLGAGKIVDFNTFKTKVTTEEYQISAKVSGTTVKEVYAVLDWNAEAFKFDTDDAEDINDDQKLDSKSFVLDDNRKIDTRLFVLNGVDSLDKIEKDDIVEVFATPSPDNEIVRVDVGTEVVEGTISKVKNGTEVTIGDKTYEMYEGTCDYKAKDEVRCLLTYSGKIFDMELVAGEKKVAVVYDWDSSSFKSTYQAKLVLSDGTLKTFDVEKDAFNKIKSIAAREGSSTTYAAVYKPMSGSDPVAVIEYRTNNDGVINSVTEITKSSYAHIVDKKVDKNGYYAGMKIADDAVILTYDTAEPEEDDRWGSTTKDKLLGADKVTAYYTHMKSGKFDVLVIDANASAATTSYTVVREGWTDDSQSGYGVEVILDGEYKQLEATKATYDIATAASDTPREVLYKVAYKNGALDVRDSGVAPADIKTIKKNASTNIEYNKSYRRISGVDASDADISVVISENATLFVWDSSDHAFKKGAVRDIDETTAQVVAYRTDDDLADGVYDYVLIW